MDFEEIAKEAVRKRNFLHGMIDHLTIEQIQELYRLMKRLYFQDMF